MVLGTWLTGTSFLFFLFHHQQQSKVMFRTLIVFACLSSAGGFVPAGGNTSQSGSSSIMKNTALESSVASEISAEILVSPSKRDAHYDGNVAQYLCDLHDSKSTFDFCGGMMFQREFGDGILSI